MASTWSALKIELLETGQNSGTWGTLTNVNLGDAVLGEAITGQATVDFASDADVTITLTDSATTQAARNLRLNITESSTGVGSVRNLILGSGCQIEKFYLINNTGTGAKTVKNTSGTGISVPAGKATLVYNNGTNVVDAASYFTSLTLGSALPVASGGTGVTTSTGTTNVVLSNSPTLVTPVLGVATATSLQGIIGNVTPAAGSFTTVDASSTATATRFIPSGATVATNGMYLPAANSLGLSTNSTNAIYIDSGQRIGIGGSPSSGSTVWNIKSITGSTTSIAYDAVGTVMSDVTSSASGYRTSISTTASAFTLSSLNHFSANQSTIGASSAVTTQIGFNVGSSLTGATNNYGFYGAIASGTNRFNLYMAGTADNYLGGALGIGTATLTGYVLHAGKSITGSAFSEGIVVDGTIQSDVTSRADIFFSAPAVQAASFTLGTLNHFFALQNAIGAGATVTNQFGVNVSSTLTGATNNYGIYSNIASGTGRWNFYAAGTAQNYFAGNVGIGITIPTESLDVRGNILVQRNANDAFNNGYQVKKGRGTAASPVVVQSGDQIGPFSWRAYDGTDYLYAAIIDAYVDGTPGTNDMPGRLVFSTTADGASTPTERLRIASAGQIGLSGANYGTSGQVLTSGGSAAAPTWTTISGTGDVVGPASSTDNAFARFDSTTGKLIQNSTGATLSDTGAAVFTGALDVLGNSTAGSNIKLYEDTDNGSNYVSFKAPDTIAANVTWTLPSADGTNTQVLQTNGSGVLSFATASGSSQWTTTGSDIYYNTGKVGIGTATPAKPLNVVSSAVTEVWVESTDTQKAIINISAGNDRINFQSTYNSGGTAARPFGFFDVSTPLVQFGLGTSIALQGATSQTGAGITFPATQSASSNANTLDDYEEGTWTPVFTGGAGSIGSTAYSSRFGSYTKIGNVVTVQMAVVMSNLGSWSDTVVFTGLPFTGVVNFQQMGSVWLDNVTFTDFVQSRVGSSENVITFAMTRSGTGGAYVTVANCTSSSVFRCSVTYLV